MKSFHPLKTCDNICCDNNISCDNIYSVIESRCAVEVVRGVFRGRQRSMVENFGESSQKLKPLTVFAKSSVGND